MDNLVALTILREDFDLKSSNAPFVHQTVNQNDPIPDTSVASKL